jgi:hypothetical protein
MSVLLVSPAAFGYIEKVYPLEDVLKESDFILVGTVESVDVKARTAIAKMDRVLKGDKIVYPSLRMNLGAGPAHHAEFVIKQIKVGAPIILFYRKDPVGVAHCGELYFQLYGPAPKAGPDGWWRMSHVEVGMGRTFNGSTTDFIALVEQVLDKKVKAPTPDPNVPRLDIDRVARAVQVGGVEGKEGFHKQIGFAHDAGGEVRGICPIDINGDGKLDLFFSRQAANLLLTAQGDSFQDWTSRAGLTGGSRGAAWSDCDGDGKVDLVTANFQLFMSAGANYKDRTRLIKAPADKAPESAGWIDFNGDGRPDILVANGKYGLCLWRNTGAADRFVDASDKALLGAKGHGAGKANYFVVFDYDGDGWSDILYNANVPLLLHNEGNGTFAPDTRCGLRFSGPAETRRGVAVGDFDNDDVPDLFIPGTKGTLWHNNNDGAFSSLASGETGDLDKLPENSFSAAWGDANGDGNLDLAVCYGDTGIRLLLGDGRGRFVDATKPLGLAELRGVWAASFADTDGDGDDDLVLALPDKIVLAINEIPQPADRGAVSVAVAPGPGLAGAVVRASDLRGRHLARRELSGADGCGGQPSQMPSLRLPLGKVTVSVCLSDGRAAARTVEVQSKPTVVKFRQEDFD